MKFTYISLISLLFSTGNCAVQQAPFQLPVKEVTPAHGRFLHITDIHMDQHYVYGATIQSDCHRKPKKHKHKKKEKGLLAGYWGAPGTDCDSSPRFVYHSIDWIAKEWKDKIDFVIWTGDNARHDGDPYITRTQKEITGYNRKVTKALQEAFAHPDRTIPIVPCLGNNDVHPHNQFRGMKNNPQLLTFSDIWSDFIPADQQRHFKRGGYFAVDVAQGIRVLSLNSLYFFGSNDVVNSCSDATSPGARHVRWLKKELKRAERDQVKVIIMGHVPPTVKTFKDSCLDDYIKLSTRHADQIMGHMYGHANFDHFQIISRQFSSVSTVQQDAGRFVDGLRKQYRMVKKAHDRSELVAIHVAPPLLPLFQPTFRINQYNTNQSSPQFGQWLKYTQYYSNLTYWNEQRDRWTHKPIPPVFEIEYETDKDYHLPDLTTASWLDFAERLGSKKHKKIWKMYVANLFVRTNNKWYGQSVPDSYWRTIKDLFH
ncbi:Metallo-dependent phosphatase-like protein [Choanephora cucurbitarum]|nr:Metallo-dependent phosphatase-like protein [Choanephora cucurbitarum]